MSDWNPEGFNPHDPTFLADPYPVYAKFRERAPVTIVKPYGSHWVFRYDDVKRVLEDQEYFTKANPNPKVKPAPFDMLANFEEGIFSSDPEPHTVMRNTMEPLFEKSIHDAADFAEGQARRLLNKNLRGRHFELFNDFAAPLPARVLFHVLGLPEAHWEGVKQWVDGCVAGNDITQAQAVLWYSGTSTMALMTYFRGMMNGKPVCPVSGRMVERLVSGAEAGGMNQEQVLASLLNLAIAGFASTTYLIATGAYRLVTNTEQLALLKSDVNKYVRSAISEMLRMDAPAQLVDRAVAKDTTLSGVKLRRGDTVSAVIGSANHDENVFDDPEKFDITRDTSKQIAFGQGIHTCLGEPLVGMSGPAAFRTLLDVYPDITLAGLPQWQTDPYLRSVVNLPLNVES